MRFEALGKNVKIRRMSEDKKSTKVKMNVYLTPAQARALKQVADDRDTSVARLVRKCVDLGLEYFRKHKES